MYIITYKKYIVKKIYYLKKYKKSYNQIHTLKITKKQMQKDTFFITTPIYYTNGIPHVGHAYASILCDTIARYQKINGKRVKFSTWVDENSQKAVLKATEMGMEIMPYLDMMAEKHKAVWDGLDIKYTDFIRTTEKRHHTLVREVLQKSFHNGDIYQAEYEWMYCIWCEGFKKDDDLVCMNKTTKETFPFSEKVKMNENILKVCPDHLTEPQKIKEKNWFFKLSKYENFLKDLYKNEPNFVMPDNRFNEVKAFVERGLEDFSISRETNKFGIKLPFDETQVSYVWFDALFNYVTVCKYPDNGWNDENFWPADLHVVAKDIIRFHAIYWPAMLKSAGYAMPKNILTTGYFTVDGQKISKSLWNAIDPVEFCKKYPKELLTLYMLSTINIGQDGDFDQKQAILTYNAKLANNMGNLVNRVVVLSLKLWWTLFEIQNISEYSETQINLSRLLIDKVNENMQIFNLKQVLDDCFWYLSSINLYVDNMEPWQMIKDETKLEETKEVLYTIAEGLRQVWLALYPFFPEKMLEMFVKLGLSNYEEKLEKWELQTLISQTEVFFIKEKWEPLFLRLNV